jgi:LPS O-antigen subunit length determinant protein (WzzB/FepE family)
VDVTILTLTATFVLVSVVVTFVAIAKWAHSETRRRPQDDTPERR